MIRISIKRQNNEVSHLKATGHAMYDEYGRDLVCAAVSAILVGGINAVNEAGYIDQCEFKCEEGFVEIFTLGHCHDMQVILETMIVQLKTIAESYSNYISIMEV